MKGGNIKGKPFKYWDKEAVEKTLGLMGLSVS